MSTSDQIAQAEYEAADLRETLDLALADARWRLVAKYAQALAEVSERLTRLQWAREQEEREEASRQRWAS